MREEKKKEREVGKNARKKRLMARKEKKKVREKARTKSKMNARNEMKRKEGWK